MNDVIDIILWLFVAISLLTVNVRWLRVAQREHYQPGRTSALALIWLRTRPVNFALLAATVVLLVGGALYWPLTIFGIAGAVAIPWNLAIFPRDDRLVFTARLKRLAAVLVAVEVVLAAATLSPQRAAALVLVAFLITDLALAICKPIEAAAAQKYVDQARKKLIRVGADVVAITGSYGKTSTKVYAAHIIGAARPTVASPASFNNMLGLSSTVNGSLTPGTEVFIAEMGTYGRGEIRRLCSVFSPRVAAITTIGEAHLERMKNRETIVAAKSEIVEGVEVAVLNVDVPELAQLAQAISARTISVSAESIDVDVCVRGEGESWVVLLSGNELVRLTAPTGGHRINLATAVGLALAVDVPSDRIASSLKRLPTSPHRAEVASDVQGRHIIDDTYNANPIGAANALRIAGRLAGSHRIWTITPGMIELGEDQFEQNRILGAAATSTDHHHLVVVQHVNRAALRAGANPDRVEFANSRAQATTIVSSRAQSGDVILYENDLPSHYP